jgi:branched-chain amino acid aminotransferase
MIATEVGLGVRPSNQATYVLIATPAAAYFDASKAVTVWISTEYVRAALGGTGEAKCGGNYAASLLAQKQAAKEGCDQVAYIDAVERKWVEEMGGMNLYFIKGSGKAAKIMTPKLTGTLLPGITRDSILTLANDLGYKTEETMISIDDWRDGVKSGEITEIFACGTAAVVSAVGAAKSIHGTWQTGDGKPGVITNEIRAALLGIQHGTVADKHGWNKRVI